MPGPRRELAIAHFAQDAAQGRLRDRYPELFPEPLRQIDQPPAHDTMHGRDRSSVDQRAKSPSMLIAEQGWLAGRLTVEQARRSLGVEPHDPVADVTDVLPVFSSGMKVSFRAGLMT